VVSEDVVELLGSGNQAQMQLIGHFKFMSSIVAPDLYYLIELESPKDTNINPAFRGDRRLFMKAEEVRYKV